MELCPSDLWLNVCIVLNVLCADCMGIRVWKRRERLGLGVEWRVEVEGS